MTYIGHSLTGLAVGAAVLPVGLSRGRMVVGLAVFAMLADIPDFPLPWWGHNAYRVSHSIFVNGALVGIALLGLSIVRMCKGAGLPKRVICGGVAAWFSHFLLDSMYNHGLGIRIYWPFSSGSLVLPVGCFSTLKRSPPPLDVHTFRVLAIELACYLPLLGVVVLARRILTGGSRLSIDD